MKWKYQIEDIDIKQLNYEFISNYEFWLKSVRKCDHNTSVKYLSNFRRSFTSLSNTAGLIKIRLSGQNDKA
jgi:hypothetical protein